MDMFDSLHSSDLVQSWEANWITPHPPPASFLSHGKAQLIIWDLFLPGKGGESGRGVYFCIEQGGRPCDPFLFHFQQNLYFGIRWCLSRRLLTYWTLKTAGPGWQQLLPRCAQLLVIFSKMIRNLELDRKRLLMPFMAQFLMAHFTCLSVSM